MIKKSLLVFLLSYLVIGCKKEGNSGILKLDSANQMKSDSTHQTILADNGKVDSTIAYNVDINGNKTLKTDYVYQATDGTLVKVIFKYGPKEYNVSIKNNNKTFILDKEKSTGKETVYKKDEMQATVKGDSLILKQGNNIIELVKTKI